MKRFFCFVAAAALLLAFAACGASPGKDILSGTPEELLAQVKEVSRADLAMNIGSEVTAEDAQRVLGMTEAQFTDNVVSAYELVPILATVAQSNVMIKCKDAVSAVLVKRFIAEGFDCDKLNGSVPDQAIVVESGSYVLLAVGTIEATGAFVEAFKRLSNDSYGEPDIFFSVT